MSKWIKWVLVGVGGLLIAIISFMLGKKSK
jgi:hypothetical protein